MIGLNIMLVALAQASVSPGTPPVARPDIEVIGPTLHNRVICRTISMSGSHIPTRQICRTTVEIEEARDRVQSEAAEDVRSTMRRTAEMLERSGPMLSRPSETSVAQTRRGGD